MKTCLDMMNDIEALRPSSTEFSFTQRAKWFDEIMRRTYRDVGVLKQVDIPITTATLSYDLTAYSTQLELGNIQKIYITTTKTTCSTDITDVSTFDEYNLTQYNDPVEPNNILFKRYFSDERIMRVRYVAVPGSMPATSSDSSTIPDIDPDAIPAIEYAVMSRICKSGDAPDVQMANAYEADYREEMRRLKAMVRTRTRKMRESQINYKEMW
jgi:hypothetical protein